LVVAEVGIDMSSHEAQNEQRVTRPPYRPPIGVPARRDSKWAGPISVALHLLLIVLMIVPLVAVHDAEDATRGAGGAGPAGGGGGGSRGARDPYLKEDLRFVHVAPPPAPPVVPPNPNALVPPVPTPIPPPKPVVTPPATVPPPTAAAPETKPDTTPVTVAAGNAPGPGNGAGLTSGPGAGPGTGGGTGTGAGPGRGSGVGPGNGGGEGNIFPPTAELLLIPELPVPGSLRGKTFIVHFEIDETGRVARVDVDTGNSSYDRRLRDRFMQYKWRPAHRLDGTPVAAGVDVPLGL
jgi:protein TonB